jgi:RNA polymerase sigma-70 factor, ECF subfamily
MQNLLTVPHASPDSSRAFAQPDFASVFRTEFDYVAASLFRLGARGVEIEDVAQDVFLVLLQKWLVVDRTRPIRPWLFGVAVRSLSSHRRKTRSRSEIPESSPDMTDQALLPLEASLGDESRALVTQALTALSEDQKAVFVLHAIDETPMPLVAESLEIPLNTAYSRYRLAKENFAKAVRQYEKGLRQ